MNLQALKTELQTDPQGLGYGTATSDLAVAGLLNQVRATITIRRTDVTPSELATAIAIADITSAGTNPSAATLSNERRWLAWLQALMTVPSVRLLNDNGSNTPAMDNLLAMFASGTGTRTRLIALGHRQGSRAEQLFGVGTIVTYEHVGQAKAT